MGQNVFIAAYTKFQLGGGIKNEGTSKEMTNPALPAGYVPLYEYGGSKKESGVDGGIDSNGNSLLGIDCTGLLSQALADAGYSGYGRFGTRQLYDGTGAFSSWATDKFDVVATRPAGDKENQHTAFLNQGKGVPLDVGDILVFRNPKGGSGHVGIFAGYDANGNPTFYGSQGSFGPAFVTVTASSKDFFNGGGRDIVGVLRPKESNYHPELDTTRSTAPTPEAQSRAIQGIFDGIAVGVEEFINKIAQQAQAQFDHAKSVLDTLTDLPTTTRDALNQQLHDLGQWANEQLNTIDRNAIDFADQVSKVLDDMGKSIDSWSSETPYDQDVLDTLLGVGDWLKQTGDSLSKATDDTFNALQDVLDSVDLPGISDAVNTAVESLITKGGKLLSEAYSIIKTSILNLVDIGHEFGYVIDTIKSKLNQAATIPSPIILDLDNDGIETTAVKAGAYFDHAADGFAERTGWAGADDGLLVRDLDGNGLIDSGRELFGSETLLNNGSKAANGFQALAELDANADGKLDSADAAFASLKVWRDADGDGYSADGELLTLAEAGVQSINVAYSTGSTVDANGNAHKQLGSYTTTAGDTRAATDVWFQTDQTYSIATEWVDVPDDIALLPDATGYGKVYDLHQAMARDPGGVLQTLVTQFTQAAGASERETLLTQIIYHWTGVQNVDPASRAASMIYGNVIGDARKLEALEQFIGEEWYGVWCWGTRDPNPHGHAAPVLLKAWGELSELVYGQLMAQSHLKPLFDQIAYAWDDASQSLVGDLTLVAAALTTDIDADRLGGLAELAEFARTLKGMGALSSLDTAGFQTALAPLGSDVSGTLNSAWAGLVATNGNDSFTGAGYLRGLGGNDSLTGGNGNDIFDGGSGDDTLNGGLGDDLYLVERGSGQDTLNDTGGSDTLKLLGLNPGEFTVTRDAANLYLALNDGSARARINGWFANAANRIEHNQFGDGTAHAATNCSQWKEAA